CRILRQLASSILSSFFLQCPGPHRALHSFPTRRSSDLPHSVLTSLQLLPILVLVFQPQFQTGQSSLLLPTLNPVTSLPSCLAPLDRKSTRLNSSHVKISYAVFCLKKKKIQKS